MTRVAILVFDDVDLLDVTGPKEVFGAIREPIESVTDDPVLRLYESKSLVSVDLIAVSPQEYITTADGTKIIPDLYLEDMKNEKYDCLVLPGGKGVHQIKKDTGIQNKLRGISPQCSILSVCTGAYLLAEANINVGGRITTHDRHEELFQQLYPQYVYVNQVRYVEEGNLIITSGVSSGIDGALRWVEQVFGKEKAESASRTLNFAFQPTS